MDLSTIVMRLPALALVVFGPVPAVAWALRRGTSDLQAMPFGAAHLVAIVLWTALQVGLGLGLGMAHLLATPALLGGELVLLLGGGALWWRARAAPALRPLLWPQQPVSPAQGSMLLAAGVMTLSLAWVTLARCVDNFDSLAYHLPIMARWVAEGWFARFDELGQTSRYPLHLELLSTLWVVPWRSDLFVALPNVLSWLHLGLAVGVLARRMGAPTEAATAAAVLLLACPTLLDRVSAIQPDIALAAFFVTAIVFLSTALQREGRSSAVGWTWITLAVLAGLKTSALGYALLAVAGGWILAARSGRRVVWLPAPGGAGWAALLSLLALGGFWYVRNWIQVGNPLGLVEVKLAGVTLLPGPLDAESLRRTTIAALFDTTEAQHWRVLGRVAMNWLGFPAAALALAALVGGAVAVARRRARRAHAAFVLVVGAIALVTYWNSPYSGDNGTHGWQVTPWIHVGLRYAYPLLAILAVAAALGMKSLRLRGAWLAPLPVAACVIHTQWTVLPGIAPLRAAVGLTLLAWLLMRRPFPWRPWVAAALAVVVVTGAAWFASAPREADRDFTYGDAYRTLQREVADDAVVGAVNVPRLYPLFGERWSRHVVDAQPVTAGREAWVTQLRRQGIDVLAVGLAPPTGQVDPLVPQAQKWVGEGAPFEQLQDAASVRSDLALYRLSK